MNTPKSLPWHARKAGVSIERAEALWAQAVREATAETGWVGNSEYWGAAMDRFQDLLVTEPARYCYLGEVFRKQDLAELIAFMRHFLEANQPLQARVFALPRCGWTKVPSNPKTCWPSLQSWPSCCVPGWRWTTPCACSLR